MADDRVLQEVVDLYHGRLVGLFRLRGCTVDSAEDLAQETMLRLVQRWAKDPVVDNWWAWLVTVGMNLQVSQWRRMATLKRRSHLIDPARSHSDVSTAEVLDLLAVLTDRQRTAVVLRYYAGFSVRETAAAMGIAEGTVKSLSAAGLAAARACLSPEEVVK